MRSWLEVGLVEGKRLTVDGTPVRANASSLSCVPREELGDVARPSRTVRKYLAQVAQENPVTDHGDRQPTPTSGAARFVSTTDPEACWAGKGGQAVPSYYDHYLVDNAHGIILGVEGTPARFRQMMFPKAVSTLGFYLLQCDAHSSLDTPPEPLSHNDYNNLPCRTKCKPTNFLARRGYRSL